MPAPSSVSRALVRYLVALQWLLPRWGTPDATGPDAAAREQAWRAAVEQLSPAERVALERAIGVLAMTIVRGRR